MSDHIARAEAARQRAIDDGRDMWGLTDWKLEAYAQEDRAKAVADEAKAALAWLTLPSDLRPQDIASARNALRRAIAMTRGEVALQELVP